MSMTELEVYNKFEGDVSKASDLQQLEDIGHWLAGVFLIEPDYKETLRSDLGKIYKIKLQKLSPNRDRKGTIYISKWIAQKIETPCELEVTVTGETTKAIKVDARAIATPTSTCRHCGRELTHPVSLLYGIGQECGKHYHIPQEGKDVEYIRELITSIEYHGWIPKSSIDSTTGINGL